MSDTNIQHLIDRMAAMEQSQQAFQKKIYAALLGEFGEDTAGLIPEHRQCRRDLVTWRAELTSLQVDVAELKLAKATTETGVKWSWQAAVLIIVVIVWLAEKMKVL